MKRLLAGLGLAVALGCSSEDGAPGSTADAGLGGAGSGGTAGGSAGAAGSGGSDTDSGIAGAPADSGLGGSPPGSVLDPTTAGPHATTLYTASAKIPATNNDVPIRCHVPAAPSGALPVVVIAHGFQLPASQYDKTAAFVSSFGFLACTADFPAGFSPNHVASAKDLLGSLDFLIAASGASGNPISGRVDPARLALSGHSLGGKLSVLAASLDPRVKAVVALDPVDSAMLCNPTDCPDASDKLPLPIPTAFLGETLDATGALQACAPKADNFETFYAKAAAPTIQVTLNGANHMSFIDDPGSCGIACGFCNAATMPQSQALQITRAYMVSFLSRHLLGKLGYDTWLSGKDAATTWITPGAISVQEKP